MIKYLRDGDRVIRPFTALGLLCDSCAVADSLTSVFMRGVPGVVSHRSYISLSYLLGAMSIRSRALGDVVVVGQQA